ncbi:MAG: cation:proton antiporter [Planctomycetota bacterium]|jgi:Kef-type K+ transport system membrane component KefB/CBS domain-containing protein|nr:cation:proton antiporter [Planctomycetota bacterium]MDP6940501.1 cation:proton antiporter [Planctomycetota bacterium]
MDLIGQVPINMQDLLLTAGLILVVGSICGEVARFLRLPTLTGYISAGILLGPQVFDSLPHEHIHAISDPVNDIAMALVLFVLGGQFRTEKLRGVGKKILTLSSIESVFSFTCVALFTLPVLPGIAGPLLLGVMAVAIAPATTLLVLDEFDAHGPSTDAIKLITALSNVWSILFFELALLLLVFLSGTSEVGPSAAVWDIFGSLFYGLIAGHALIVIQDRTGHGNYSLPLLAVIALTIGASKVTGVPHMLAFLVTGGVVANRSRYFEPITKSMGAFAPPAYVAFFVLSGIHLDFGLLAENWIAAGVYVLARTIGKVAGARAGLKISGLQFLNPQDRSSPPVGLALLCQAGVAITLAHVAMKYNPELGQTLLNIILGAVVLFELVGPLLVKHVAVAAGEVNIGHLLVRSSDERGTSFFSSILRSIRGRRNWKAADLAGFTLGRMMRGTTTPLSESAPMDDILRYANHARSNQFPVVNADGEFVGMIRLRDLEELAYDPHAASLVIAGDLTSLGVEEVSLPASATIEEAASAFSEYRGNNLVVIESKENPRYLGMVEKADLLQLVSQLEHSRLQDGPQTEN